MQLTIVELKNYQDRSFKSCFLSYFEEIGVKLPEGYDVFSDIELSAKNEQMMTVVAKHNQDIIGFIMFQPEQFSSASKFFTQDTMFIREFSIQKEFRSSGIGTKLMQYVFEYCEQHAIHSIILTTHTAKEFYIKLGFVEDSSYIAVNKQTILIKKI